MTKEIVMPKMGDEMTEGKLVNWLKREGATISKGEPLAEIETDKVTVEIEASDSGVLQCLLVAEGQMVLVGDVLALIATETEAQTQELSPPQAQANAPQQAQMSQRITSQTAPTLATFQEAPFPMGTGEERALASGIALQRPLVAVLDAEPSATRAKASPLARRIAQVYGLDLVAIRGTGPGGRVVRSDVEHEVEKGLFTPMSTSGTPQPPSVPAQEIALVPRVEAARLPADEQVLTRLQQTMARRMLESKTNAPHFYLTSEIDVTEMMALRSRLNQEVDVDEKISVNDLVLKAVAKTLPTFPALNASFAGDRLLLHKEISLAVAIAMQDGLVTPVLRHVDEKAIGQIARETKGLAERARSGKSRVEDYASGTFTVSNLGMFGIDTFHAIINPPQAAILAVGAVRRIPVYIGDDLVPRERVSMTLSADHRVTDGATGAQFLSQLRSFLEHPLRLLV